MDESRTSARISAEDQSRIVRSARQIVAYTHFLRWSANFRRDELNKHPQNDKVMLLSAMQSGRFSFAIENDTLFLGVQPFEAVWMGPMPFSRAYVSDRLYLLTEGGHCMDSRLSSIALGIFVDDAEKLARMKQCKRLQLISVSIDSGRVASVSDALSESFPLCGDDIIASMRQNAEQRVQQQDLGRFL